MIKITVRNKFTICLKAPLFCRWSCNFYRIWCCFCSGCVRAPVESCTVCQSMYQHMALQDQWFSSDLNTCPWNSTSGPCWLSHQPENLWIFTKHHLSNVIACRLCSFTHYFKLHPTLFPMQVWVSIFLHFSHLSFITKTAGVIWHISFKQTSLFILFLYFSNKTKVPTSWRQLFGLLCFVLHLQSGRNLV